MMHVIRRANQRSFREIHQEIRSVQARPVPSNKGMTPWVRFFMLQPRPVSSLFVALMRAAARRNPTLNPRIRVLQDLTEATQTPVRLWPDPV